jgi:predicted ATPase/DNA-binding SARP family transcriptional activator
MTAIEISLFGPPHITRAGQKFDLGHRKSTALLVYLVVTKQSYSRDLLASLLWPDEETRKSSGNLRRALYRINHLLDSPLLTASHHSISIHPEANIWVDVHEFQSIAAQIQHDPKDDCTQKLEQAAALCRNDFLAGFSLPDCPAFDEWQFFQAETLRRLHADILARLSSLYEEKRLWEKAILNQRKLLSLDPLSEPANRKLMSLYAQSDQPVAALRQFEELRRRLAQELSAAPDSETSQLYKAIKTRQYPVVPPGLGVDPEDNPLSSQFIAPQNTLPTKTIAFAGRKQELKQVADLISSASGTRLLTITGPGGIGKTRLSVETAQTLLPLFSDGIYFIPAANFTKLTRLIAAICEQTGLRYYSTGDLKSQLFRYLRERNCLLLIDNFDHLIDEAAFISELLEAAPQVSVLVTSRERLNLSSEQVYPLAGLSYQATNNENAWDIEAVQLLVHLTRLARPDLKVTNRDLPHILRICELVGGMPLALVLAAGWLELLTLKEISEEIARNLDFLHGKFYDLPERQHSIRAAFEYSWEKLSVFEQLVLMRTSVFKGGFTRHAALSIAGADLSAMRTLIDKSLIYVSGVSRYDVHPVIALFAHEKMAETGETGYIRARHSRYYLEFLCLLEKDIKSQRQLEAMQEIENDLGNIRAAWEYAAQHQDVSTAGQAVESLYLFFATRSRYQEGLEWCEDAYQHLKNCDKDLPALYRILARMYWFRGILLPVDPPTKKGIQTLLAHNRKQKNQAETAFCLLALGCYDLYAWHNAAKAVVRFEQCLQIYQKLDDRFYIAIALLWLSTAHGDATNLANMVHFTRQSMELARETGNIPLIAFNLRNLTFASLCNGSYAEAEVYNQEALSLDQEIGLQMGVANALTYAGLLNFLKGNMERAQTLTEKGLKLAKEVNLSALIVEANAIISLLASLSGNPQQGLLISEEILSKQTSHFGTILSKWAVALSKCRLGQYQSAEIYVREAIQQAQQLAYPAVIIWLLPLAAMIDYHQKRFNKAARLYNLGINHAFALQGWMSYWDELMDLSKEINRFSSPQLTRKDLETDPIINSSKWLLDPI